MPDITRLSSLRIAAIAFALALALATGAAFADKPEWAGGGKSNEGKQRRAEKERGDGDRNEDRRRISGATHFRDDDRRAVSEYYGNEMRKGKCPPGLAKKRNGCQPPGQAKKWHRGQVLAKDIRYYELPKELRVRLPVPPPNHRYVQVAGDILMIAIGTGVVVDAIEDIMR